MKVTTGVTAPGRALRPDFSRGSSPPVPPRHLNDYSALDDMQHGRVGASLRRDKNDHRTDRIVYGGVLLLVVGCAWMLLGALGLALAAGYYVLIGGALWLVRRAR